MGSNSSINLSAIICSAALSFNVFKNATENALYRICKNFKPKNKNLKYFITDTNGKILKNSFELKKLLEGINWKKFNIKLSSLTKKS